MLTDQWFSIPASELIVVGGDLNGHVGTNVDGYDGVHGGYGFGERNADGERILKFCDAMELIVTNTCFRRQNKLTTYVSGGTVSATDYLLLWRCDRRCIKSLLKKCVSQHWLLVVDVVISCAPRKKREHTYQGWKYGSRERAQCICSVGNKIEKMMYLKPTM